MRTWVAFGIGAVAALAISAAVATTINANNSPTEASARTEHAAVVDDKAEVAASKANAAEAKVKCEKERQEASNTGAVVGGLTGAVIGSQVAGDGAKTEGGVLGGTVGVLTGRQIAKKDHRC